MTCEFENMDREIKTQIVQNCLSHKLRMKALQNPDLTFTQLMEMSKSQADNIEGEQDVNKLSKERNTRPISKPNKDGGHVDRKSSRSKLRNRNIAPGESLRMENLAVGVANKTIFKRYVDPKILTREMTPKIEKWDVQNLAYDNSSFEKSNDIDYTFPVNTNGKMKSQPMFQVMFLLLAAILSQKDQETGTSHIITYASRSLTETEQRYGQTEREALGIIWACEHLHLYIYGKPLTVYTDHKPLVSIFGNPSSKPPPRIERWALRLQPYQLTVHYRKGDGNPAYYLSRHPTKQITTASREQKIAKEYVNYIVSTSTPKAMTVAEIEEATKADETLQAVSKAIETGDWYEGSQQSGVDTAVFAAWQKVKNELTVGINPQVVLRGTRVALPSKLQQCVVNLAHA